MKWIILGITGATCSGKSTLARSIINQINGGKLQLPRHRSIGNVRLVKQDDYFYPKTSAEHIWIPEFNYINREVLSALNMTKMRSDVNNILGSTYQPYNKKTEDAVVNILVIEGFLIFNCKEIRDLCQIKLCLTLSYEECFKRRKCRTYNPPNPIGYFEKIVWPSYFKYFNECKDIKGLSVLNGELAEEIILAEAMKCIENYL